jgi:hypothetical protein
VKRVKKSGTLENEKTDPTYLQRESNMGDTQRQYGKLGAASVVRRVEVSAVDATALVTQMEEHTARAEAQRLLGGRR